MIAFSINTNQTDPLAYRLSDHRSNPIIALSTYWSDPTDQLPWQEISLRNWSVTLTNSVASTLIAELIYPAILLLIYQAIPLPSQLSHYSLTIPPLPPADLPSCLPSCLPTDLTSDTVTRAVGTRDKADRLAISIHLSRAAHGNNKSNKEVINSFIYFLILYFFFFFFFGTLWRAANRRDHQQTQHSNKSSPNKGCGNWSLGKMCELLAQWDTYEMSTKVKAIFTRRK